jgi:hypothetical protein
MVMDSLISQKTGKPLVNNVRRQVIDKMYDWGLYVYKKSDGKWFTDGEGNVLNIPSNKGDLAQIKKLRDAAVHYGDDGEGECVFVPGLERVSDEVYAEQVERMNQGLIPNLNDLGAVQAAKKTLELYGDEE